MNWLWGVVIVCLVILFPIYLYLLSKYYHLGKQEALKELIKKALREREDK